MGDYNATAQPQWLNTSDETGLLSAASLVGLLTIPGMAIMCAGFMSSKWAINSAFMVFSGFAIVMICWGLWAYKIAFGEHMLPFAGRPGPVVTIIKQLGQSSFQSIPIAQDVTVSSMVYYHFVLAAFSISIPAGSFLGRMNFTAWMLFVPFWITFSYSVGAFSLWGGGFLFQKGVIDYSGGYVIHLSSGVAGGVGAWWVGPRYMQDRETRPGNALCVFLGAGILWMGWNGFSHGHSNSVTTAGVAILNTNFCTAMSMSCWIICDMIYYKKPSMFGAVQGMRTGLVAISSGSGVVDGWGAIVIGVMSGTGTWMSMNIAGRRVSFLNTVDDQLGNFHVHAVASLVGGLWLGVFATKEGCAASGLRSLGGAIDGNGKQVWLQIVGALFIIGWNIVWTSLILIFIKYLLRTPLHMTETELIIGDQEVHGEGV